MKDTNKNIEINSQNLNGIIEKKDSILKDLTDMKNEVSKNTGLLKYLPTFEKSPLFENITLKKGDFLFNEGESNNNLYIIKKGLLSIEKYTTTQQNDTKQLAILKTGDFLGEGSFNKETSKKEVLAKALNNCEVLSIDGKKDIKKFIEEFPSVGYELLKTIILDTNKRLLESNKLLTSNYEIEKAINNLKTIDNKSIFNLIDTIKNIVGVDYILYFEKNMILSDFLSLKYDSRQPNRMQDLTFEKKGYFLDLDELFEKCNIKQEDKLVINKLSIGTEVYGYLIFARVSRAFDGSDKKLFSSVGNSLAGVLKKFLSDKEDKNKIYLNEMKMF